MKSADDDAKQALSEMRAWWKGGSTEGSPEEQVLLDRFGALTDQPGPFMGALRRVAEDADNPLPWSARGRAALSRGELTQAIAAFERALALGATDGATLGALEQARFTAARVRGPQAPAIEARPFATAAH